MTYLRYAPSLERIQEDEHRTFERIAETFAAAGARVEARDRRASRVSHAKATALLTGELIVEDGLPAELAQGIATMPERFGAIVRFAQGPGEVLDDDISTHRGMAVRILDVGGERIEESDEASAQDFLLEAKSTVFLNANATTFLVNLRAGVGNAPALPEGVKRAVSAVARSVESGLESLGLQSKTLDFFGHEPLNPLAESYFSQVPLRWGDYVAKIGFFPTSETLDALEEVEIDARGDRDAFRTALQRHFATTGATFELRVQLATDLENTPIEDATHEWPEHDNPYRSVARLVLPPQMAWSAERDGYFERISFKPANSLAAHRPLGQIMRARLFVYAMLAGRRQRDNGETAAHPASIADVT